MTSGCGVERFRGGYPATIDAKGRVKLPARLREQLESGFSREVYVCSFFPHEIRIFPLQIWERYEEQLLQKPNTPAVLRHKERVSYGGLLEIDDNGRILVPALLREMVNVEGEVVITGRINHLAITNKDRVAAILKEATPTDEDLQELAQLEL